MARRSDGTDSWGAFQLRYIAYRKKPTWNTWAHGPDRRGNLARRNLEKMREKGQGAIDRLNAAIRRLKRDPRHPKRPSQLGQREIDRIVRERLLPRRLLDTFWEAVVFTLDNYTCQYCLRSVSSVWRESKQRRTIGLTCDHLRPRVRQGGDYSFENRFTACWSCNYIKSTLRPEVFRIELESLARAVLSRVQAKAPWPPASRRR